MPTIETEPTLFRSNVTRSHAAKVERDGGDYGVGLIRGASIITRGEASGHEHWVDAFAVNQVAEKINATTNGLKMRFTHPGLSSDGLGKLTARVKNARVQGDQAIGDLHIVKSARETPDGDLGKYAMDLAEEDGDLFGVSIVFYHDYEAEDQFALEYQEESEYEDHRGRTVKEMRFVSPDADNKNNYPHIRLESLVAADLVDEPAANPNGLFHRPDQDMAREAYALATYVCGLTDEKPNGSFGFDPNRAKQFFQRFLANQDLEVIPKMAKQQESQELSTPSIKELGTQYKERFGNLLGSQYLADGLTLEEADSQFHRDQIAAKDSQIEELSKQIEAYQAEVSQLKSQLAAAQKLSSAGGDSPVETVAATEGHSNGKRRAFASVEK